VVRRRLAPVARGQRDQVVDEPEAHRVRLELADRVLLDAGEAVPEGVDHVRAEHPVMPDRHAAAAHLARRPRGLTGELLRGRDGVVLDVEAPEEAVGGRVPVVHAADERLEVVLDRRREPVAHDVVAVPARIVRQRVLLEQLRGRDARADAQGVELTQQVRARAEEAGRYRVVGAEARDRAARALRGIRAAVEEHTVTEALRGDAAEDRRLRELVEPLVVAEEEQPVADDGTAERAAVDLLVEPRRLAGLPLPKLRELQEAVGGGPGGVALGPVARSVAAVRARLWGARPPRGP